MMSRDPTDHTRDLNTLSAKYLENSWLCYYLATFGNYSLSSAMGQYGWLLVSGGCRKSWTVVFFVCS